MGGKSMKKMALLVSSLRPRFSTVEVEKKKKNRKENKAGKIPIRFRLSRPIDLASDSPFSSSPESRRTIFPIPFFLIEERKEEREEKQDIEAKRHFQQTELHWPEG